MVLLLSVGLFKFQQVKKGRAETVIALLPEDTDISLDQVHQTSTREGVKEWSLDAASVRYQKKEGRSLLTDVSVTFFLKDGKTVHVTGRQGVLLAETKDIEIMGDVVVRTGQYTLKTEKLAYNDKTRAVHTDAPIKLEGDGVSLFGKTLAFSFVNEQGEVGGGVTAIVNEFSL